MVSCQLQGIDMFEDMRSLPNGERPHPADELRAEFKYNWEVPVISRDLKTTFNHELIGLDYIICWSFRFDNCSSDAPADTCKFLEQQNARPADENRIIDHLGCTGRICTSYENHQGVSVRIPDSLKGCAFLIDDIRDSSRQELHPDMDREGHRFIRVVSLKALLQATFDQPPDSSIDWTPAQSASALLSSASLSRQHSTSASCLPCCLSHPHFLSVPKHQQASSHHRPMHVHCPFGKRVQWMGRKQGCRAILLRAPALQHRLNTCLLV